MTDTKASAGAMRAHFEKWLDDLPECPDTCDGDLIGTPHEPDCPVGKAGGFATHYDAFCAGCTARETHVAELVEALERTLSRLKMSFHAKPVLDATETILEAESALRRFKEDL